MLEYLMARFHMGENEEGQTAVEYTLVLVLVSLVLVAAVAALEGSLDGAVTTITNALTP